MSRIGKQIIILPTGVEAKLDARLLTIKGPKGEIKQEIHPQVTVLIEDRNISVKVENEIDKKQRALWGLFASVIKNMVEGVVKGYEKKLEIQGVGFKAAVSGKNLVLNLGFSHPVNFPIPAGVNITMAENIMTITGADKQVVGEITAQIRRLKKPEPYKGKGIRYVGEAVRRKAGKAAAAAK